MLGSGSYGTVFRHKNMALKKSYCTDLVSFQAIVREICVLSQQLPFCIKYHGFKKEFNYYCIFMDMADGDLRHLKAPKNARIQILSAVFHLHENNIFHRDLKPENILVKGSNIFLCDFGMSRSWSDDVQGTGYIVSRWYRAPEIYYHPRKKIVYTEAMDNYAVGCILHEIEFGVPLNKNMTFCFQVKDKMVHGLTQLNPKNRLTMEDCLGKRFKKKQMHIELSEKSKCLYRRFPYHKHVFEHADRMVAEHRISYEDACYFSAVAYGSIDQLIDVLQPHFNLNTDKIFQF